MANDSNYTSGTRSGFRGISFLLFSLGFIVFAFAYRFGGTSELKQYTVPLTATVTHCESYQEVYEESYDRKRTETFSNLKVDCTLDNGRPLSFSIVYEPGNYQVGQQVQIRSNESYTDAILDREHTSFAVFLILLLFGVPGIIFAVMEWRGKGRSV